MLVVVGGQQSAEGGLMPIWTYTVGRQCSVAEQRSARRHAGRSISREFESCAAVGAQCDGRRGACLCANGDVPPCDPVAGGRRAETVLHDGGLRTIGNAWAIVGVSVLGARLGAALGPHLGTLLQMVRSRASVPVRRDG
jgi:hypothetical protein